ncbi:glycosyltransferase [Pedobacter aquae]|nr:glycosyltransferase [Pedobacter aquae]
MSVAKLCEEIQAESERRGLGSPVTEDRSLAAHNPELATGNSELETDGRSPMTEDRRPQRNSLIDTKLETGNSELETDGRSPMTEDRRPQRNSLIDTKLETGNSELETDGRSPMTDDHSLTAHNPELATDNWQPTTRSPMTEDGRLEGDSRTGLGNGGFDSAQPDKMIISVYTTLANGKEELPYQNGETKMVDGVEVSYFKRITKDHSHFSPALLWHLWKTVKQFDVVHIHAWWNLVTMPACLIALCRGVKVVLSPRGTLSLYSFEKDKSLLKKVFHQLLGKHLLNACYFHTTSAKEAGDTQALLKPKSIFNIPNFVKLPWEKKLNKKEKIDCTLKLIFLSRIEEKKGLELLFEVLNELDFPWELSVVGDGEMEYVERLKSEDGGPKSADRRLDGEQQEVISDVERLKLEEDRGPKSADRRLDGEQIEGISDVERLKLEEDRGPQSADRRLDGEQIEGISDVERFKSEDRGPKSADRRLDGERQEVVREVESWERRPNTEEGRLGGEQHEVISEDGIKKKSFAKRVHWLGPVYGDEKFDLLAAHDLFVLPSYDENFANVVIESLYSGTPVLITENVGLSDYVKEKDLGWVCKRTAPALKESLIKAYKAIINRDIAFNGLQNTIRKDYEEGNILHHYQTMYHYINTH